jgi:hypothetical protein
MNRTTARNLRHHIAVHEAAQAVVARKLGVAVPFVSVRLAPSKAMTEFATPNPNSVGVDAYDTDAKLSLAGRLANHRELPDLPILVAEDDCVRAALAAHAAHCASRDDVVSDAIKDDAETMFRLMDGLIANVTVLIDQFWPAIQRVAKHLERNDQLEQAELDRLIEVGMRNVRQRRHAAVGLGLRLLGPDAG